MEPSVAGLAHRYARPEEPWEDLAQVGRLGVLQALERWQPGRQTRFTTLAYALARGMMRHHLREAGVVHQPAWLFEARCKVRRIESEVQTAGQRISDEHLAARSGIDLATLARVRQTETLFASPLPLGAPEHEPDGAGDSEGFAPRDAERCPALWSAIDRTPDLRLTIEQAMACLPERMGEAMRLRYMEGLSWTEVAIRMEVSVTYASSLGAEGAQRLRHLFFRWEHESQRLTGSSHHLLSA
jgi:RNA polymerase sigma-B factor